MDKLAELSVYCGFAKETDDKAAAVDKFMAVLDDLLKTCGLEKGCDLIS
jgi:hypothetical protein